MPELIQRVTASSRGSVSVWGAITPAGLGPLVKIHNKLNTVMYCAVLGNIMLPYLLNRPFSDGYFILQQDNFPIHKCRKVGAFLVSRCVPVLEWPAQYQDLSTIEEVWGTMKASMARRPLHGLSADALWAVVTEDWEQLRVNRSFCASLHSFWPGRKWAVIDAAGKATRY
ncbi:hypothetical protein HPB51_007754 [Rhipicephalus microplus]|uniref:Tc1-like transposase DDE domain-containing protein n=1 Tax=Rhipicephalus microplus TaxID=6941 RepID=A0A9J6EFG1_RHIMP|nr:hypothetical protein HPB51_007754 [Rhipicephalus microplus]